MTILHLYFAFLTIGALGLLLSLVFSEFGDHGDVHDLGGHDVGDHGDSPKLFSLRVIFSFLLAFGIGGGAMYFSDKSLTGQLIVGFLAGIATAGFTYWFMRILYGFQGNSIVDMKNLIGNDAIVTIGTTQNGSCQVKIHTISGDQLFMAQEANSKILKSNEIVEVSGVIGTTLLVLKKETNK